MQTGNVAELVLDKLEKEGTAMADAHVAFCIDPLVKGLSQKGDFCSPNGEKCFAKIASLIEQTREYKHIRIVTVSAGIFSNAGSTIVEELAFALSAGNDYLARLTDAGVDAEHGCPQAALLVLGHLQLLHGDRQVPRGAHAVGQHRQGLQPREELRLQNARSTPARQTGTRPFTIPMSICSAARRRPCRPPSPAYIRWR